MFKNSLKTELPYSPSDNYIIFSDNRTAKVVLII